MPCICTFNSQSLHLWSCRHLGSKIGPFFCLFFFAFHIVTRTVLPTVCRVNPVGWGYDRKVALGKKMLVEVRICVCRYIDTFHWLRFEEEGGKQRGGLSASG